uniref:Uncharacterized protein n=1 Tax=Heterorhabditis bacteriophora TaxID=37862 RepID=A0A1I7WY81_HETBA
MCAFRIVVYNPFFVTSNNFPQKVLLALPGKQRDVFVEPYMVPTFRTCKFSPSHAIVWRPLLYQLLAVP